MHHKTYLKLNAFENRHIHKTNKIISTTNLSTALNLKRNKITFSNKKTTSSQLISCCYS